MPELPEVETVRRGLAPVLEGSMLAGVELRREGLRFPFTPGMAGRLAGRRVTSLSRRAKYLLATLDDGSTLLMHLGMSGSFRVASGKDRSATDERPGDFHHPRSEFARHDHVVFHVIREGQEDSRIIYNDPRRFGFMLLVPADELGDHPLLCGLGMEPTGNKLSGKALAPLFCGRKAPLKATLLDQRIIAGLGNIYVCEALHGAGLSPKRRTGTLVRGDGRPTARLDLLASEIRTVIARAIEAGGSSLRDHRLTDGSLGYFQHSFSVYDREGKACKRAGCSGLIRRIVQSGRSTFHCPACQR